MKYNIKQQMQLDKIDQAIELIRQVQESGQWAALEKSKGELYRARAKMVRGYELAQMRIDTVVNNHVK